MKLLRTPRLPQLPPMIFKVTPYSLYVSSESWLEWGLGLRLKTRSSSDKVEGYIHLADNTSSNGNSYALSNVDLKWLELELLWFALGVSHQCKDFDIAVSKLSRRFRQIFVAFSENVNFIHIHKVFVLAIPS